eukprot:GHVU01068121.1.p1 GENE.GHVU01068121.1~~GHVU01068121.1.p1  ORF type:complete len:114 (-),score=3.36 GHVU01068121.1:1390-1731(-)
MNFTFFHSRIQMLTISLPFLQISLLLIIEGSPASNTGPRITTQAHVAQQLRHYRKWFQYGTPFRCLLPDNTIGAWLTIRPQESSVKRNVTSHRKNCVIDRVSFVPPPSSACVV